MKKTLLVLVALMGIGFSATAQSCEVGNNTYVGVETKIKDGHILCSAYYYGDNVPQSGMVYATVYYVDKNGNDDYETITIRWDKTNGNQLLLSGGYGPQGNLWKGVRSDVERIKSYKVSAGACRFSR